uniref:Serpentine Receptor, class T n=1 Tax=Caenorhabditis tropicalis TaxID=1561998 RepID=A0A1I7T903_9PELO
MPALQMSLFHVFTNSFTLWPDAYECPQNLTTTLYIPCFLAIIQKRLRVPVYQIMFALAIFDILSLTVNSVCTGIFDILGISFCHYPLIIFCLGAIAGGSWMAGCLACVMLAIERCVEINPDFPLEFLFRKKVFPFVRIVMLIWFLYSFGFVKSLTFSSEYSCWFFDPLIGKNPLLYHSYPHTINNFAVGISTTVLYIYISYRLIFKYGYTTSMWLYKTKRQILFQAVSLCIFHTAAAFIYEYMQFIEVTPRIIIASQFIWQWSNGAVCIAYLVFNRTIRNLVLKMLLPKDVRKRFGLYIGADEHIALEEAAVTVSAAVNAVGTVIKFDNFFSPC